MSCPCGSVGCACQEACYCHPYFCFCITCYVLRENHCRLCNLPCFYRSQIPPQGFCSCFSGGRQATLSPQGQNSIVTNGLLDSSYDASDSLTNGHSLPTLSLASSQNIQPASHSGFQNQQTGEVSNKLDISDCQARGNEPTKEIKLPVISLEQTGSGMEQVPPSSQPSKNKRLGMEQVPPSSQPSKNKPFPLPLPRSHRALQKTSSDSDPPTARPLKRSPRHKGRRSNKTAEGGVRQKEPDSGNKPDKGKKTGLKKSSPKSTNPGEKDRIIVRSDLSRPQLTNYRNSTYYVPSTGGPPVPMPPLFAPPPTSRVPPPFYRNRSPFTQNVPPTPACPPFQRASNSSRPALSSRMPTQQSLNANPQQIIPTRSLRNYPLYSIRGNLANWVDPRNKDPNFLLRLSTSKEASPKKTDFSVPKSTDRAEESVSNPQSASRNLMDHAMSSGTQTANPTEEARAVSTDCLNLSPDPESFSRENIRANVSCNTSNASEDEISSTHAEDSHDILENSNILNQLQDTHLDDDSDKT